jgi:membrane-associated phospholipid phosphatase
MGFVDGHRDTVLTTLARWAMFAGTDDRALLGWVVAALVVVIASRRWRLGAAVGGAVVAAQAIDRALKTIIARPRPPADLSIVQVGAWSMPSTVAAMTAALATALFLSIAWPTATMRRSAGVALALGVVAVGCAMVYLGAHWPTDVLVGWLLGVGVGVIAARLSRLTGLPGRPRIA